MVAVYQPNVNNMKNTRSESPIVRIVDPRHPLYGRSFPLLKTINRRGAKSICVVQTDLGITRHVPLEVTNKGEVPVSINHVPISIESLLTLSNTYFSNTDDVAE